MQHALRQTEGHDNWVGVDKGVSFEAALEMCVGKSKRKQIYMYCACALALPLEHLQRTDRISVGSPDMAIQTTYSSHMHIQPCSLGYAHAMRAHMEENTHCQRHDRCEAERESE